MFVFALCICILHLMMGRYTLHPWSEQIIFNGSKFVYYTENIILINFGVYFIVYNIFPTQNDVFVLRCMTLLYLDYTCVGLENVQGPLRYCMCALSLANSTFTN